jgi:hypothetical protein
MLHESEGIPWGFFEGFLKGFFGESPLGFLGSNYEE